MADIEDASPGSGLVYEDHLPLCWRQLTDLPDPVQLRNTHQSNEQVLRYFASVDEARSDSGDEEHGPLAQEIARLEYKIDLLLDLTGRLLSRQVTLPEAVPVRLSATGLQWEAQHSPDVGSSVAVELYLNRRFPNPILLYGRVDAVHPSESGYRIDMSFQGVSEPVRNWLEKLIFRQHRRRIAHARGAGRDRV